MKLILKEGTTETLSADQDKITLMSYEAGDFARYIEDYNQYKGEIDKLLGISLKVNRLLEAMRKDANIEF